MFLLKNTDLIVIFVLRHKVFAVRGRRLKREKDLAGLTCLVMIGPSLGRPVFTYE